MKTRIRNDGTFEDREMRGAGFSRTWSVGIAEAVMALALCSSAAYAQTVFEDRLEKLYPWSTFSSAGVNTALQSDDGVEGKGLRLDVEFPKGSGYGGVVRNFELALPQDFRIVFMLRGDVPVNDFEVKISSDSGGENIWWVNNRNYEYPRKWKRIVLRKRHFSFAWGPSPAPHPDTLRRLEFVVTAGTGGAGSIWIDNVEVQSVPPPPHPLPVPTARASSFVEGSPPYAVLPGVDGEWESRVSGNQWLEVDFGYPREFSGVRLNFPAEASNLDYTLLGSRDRKRFDTLRVVRGGAGGLRVIHTPEAEAMVLRLSFARTGDAQSIRVREISLVSSDSMATQNAFIETLASRTAPGRYPRYFGKQSSYWTVVGVERARSEALMNEDGMWEAGAYRFSLEPFVRNVGGDLLTWAESENTQSLAANYLPIPTVARHWEDISLSVTLLAEGTEEKSAFLSKYVVRNISSRFQKGSFYLTIRPFQVNPSYQWLNRVGGVANIRHIRIDGTTAEVDEASVTVSGSPGAAGVTHEDAGGIVARLQHGIPGTMTEVTDESGLASAAFEYAYALGPGDSMVVIAAIPAEPGADRWRDISPTVEGFEAAYARSVDAWGKRLNTVRISGPPEVDRLFDIIRSTLAYILINKDGHGIQPGSRSYERSWIRDGSMTSSALLKLGVQDDVRDFLAWYSSFQYESGMVPCVVDWRGPDPVPEHDSHGQLIFGLMEYFRFTKDTVFLRDHWENIRAAVGYIQTLRATRLTEEYEEGTAEKRAFYGLVPESISHEGYSAKPMHSYWDDFFVLKGFKDAATAAAALGLSETAREYDSLSRAFRTDFYSSIRLAMALKEIDYIPGCVELGDFDPTSTSIGLFPSGELERIPQPAFANTFEKYYTWFGQRKRGEIGWTAYTPYEVRNVGTYVYLGQKRRAHELLDWFLGHQRPKGWNHWAEVVWNDERYPGFIGDMPHTWVGSDFINAVRSMFVYERDGDHALVIGAGLKEGWVREGISVSGLPTYRGPLTYSIRGESEGSVHLIISEPVSSGAPAALVPVDLLPGTPRAVYVGGKPAKTDGGFITIDSIPAVVELKHR